MAFLAATLRRREAIEAEEVILVFRETDAPGERAGF